MDQRGVGVFEFRNETQFECGGNIVLQARLLVVLALIVYM